MAIVYIPAQMRDLTGGQTTFQLEGDTVRDLVNALEARFPGAAARLCREGSLAPALQVSIDDRMSSHGLDAEVAPQSEVHFLPAFGGG